MKQKFDTTPKSKRYGVFAVIGADGKITSYVDRSLVNPSGNILLIDFDSAGKAKQCADKLNFAGKKYGNWARSQSQAEAIWNADLHIPQHVTIAWVICYRPRYLRPNVMPYCMRPFTENEEPDASIIYEHPDHTQAEFVREILRREFMVNNVTCKSMQEVTDLINAYRVEVIL